MLVIRCCMLRNKLRDSTGCLPMQSSGHSVSLFLSICMNAEYFIVTCSAVSAICQRIK